MQSTAAYNREILSCPVIVSNPEFLFSCVTLITQQRYQLQKYPLSSGFLRPVIKTIATRGDLRGEGMEKSDCAVCVVG